MTFTHIARELNAGADAQANRAMDDGGSSVQEHPELARASLATGTNSSLFVSADPDADIPDPGIRSARRCRLTTTPSDAELRTLLSSMHSQSRKLRALPPSKLWPLHWVEAWQQACKDFTPHLREALDDGSELALLQALLDLLDLPGHVLLPLLNQQTEHPRAARPPPGIPDPLPQSQPAQLAAKKRAYQDLWAKDFQAAV